MQICPEGYNYGRGRGEGKGPVVTGGEVLDEEVAPEKRLMAEGWRGVIVRGRELEEGAWLDLESNDEGIRKTVRIEHTY